jgi:hypothetical protein
MADVEDHVRELAAAVVAEFGRHAHHWSKRRADRFRKEGDATGVELWQRVSHLVLQIQSEPDGRRYH